MPVTISMTREQFDQFMQERPSLTLNALSVELGRKRNYLQQQLPKAGELGRYEGLLLPLMQKYGYK